MQKSDVTMKESRKKDCIIFVLIFVIALILFAGYLTPHFATDTYMIYEKTYLGYAMENSLVDGRIIQFGIMNILDFLHIPIEISTVILLILAVLSSCIAVMVIKNEIGKYKKLNYKIGQIFLIVVSFFTIFHFMYIENMYFQECFVMALSILFYILSAKCIVEKGKHYLLKSSLLMLLAIFCYQGTISCFFITALVFSILKENAWKNILKNMLISIAIGIFSIFINLIFVAIIENMLHLEQGRGFAPNELLGNILYIFENGKDVLLYTGNLYHSHYFIIFLLLIEFLLSIKLVKEKNKNGDSILIEQFIIIIAGIAFSFITSVYNLDGFHSGRIRFSIGSLIGFQLIHIIAKTDLLEKNNLINILIEIIAIAYFATICFTIVTNIETVKQVNKLDQQNAQEIGNYIEDYEKNTKEKVKYLSIVIETGKTGLAYYPDLYYVGSITTCSAIRTKWSALGTINYYNHTNLEEKEPTEFDIEQYRQQVDEKQYLCIDDTLYITCYMY